MKKQKETFSSLALSFQYSYDLRTVFDDFLTMSICACGMNPSTGLSYDEDLYLQTIEKYRADKLRHTFPKMFAAMSLEMEHRLTGGGGNDVLGDFYQEHLYRKGASQFFTPWPVCQFMAKCLAADGITREPPLRILDPCCGSGRLLVCGSREFGPEHYYLGIDLDHTCVKMTALNMFLNGIFHGEVMWANALSPDDFRMSYKLSMFPFGIFRIEDSEQSLLYKLHKGSFERRSTEPKPPDKMNEEAGQGGSQLELF